MLVLDEATANVDRDTDALILTALDEHVHPPAHAATSAHRAATAASGDGKVLLIIAHRIDTIMDADHLLVRLLGDCWMACQSPSPVSATTHHRTACVAA